jgi:tetratricopeptide (TPR) repeat protein
MAGLKSKGGALTLAGLIVLGLSGVAAPAATDGAAGIGGPAISALGAYLAARHAQNERDYPRAAEFMDRALAEDPGNSELMRRDFRLRLGSGRIADALPLAVHIADLDRSSSLAQLVLLLQDVKAGRYADALQRAQTLPHEGAERFIAPVLVAWCEVGVGRSDDALQGLANIPPAASLDELDQLHRALIADQGDRIDMAAGLYDRITAADAHLAWRTVEIAGNFFERHQRGPAARRLYDRLSDSEEGNATIAAALEHLEAGTIPPRIVTSPRDGVAEALFDLATALNRRETLDASLIYVRLALEMRPDFPIAQLLLAEIDEQQQHQNAALALYEAIDPHSSLGWSARLRAAGILDQLDRTEEAVALLGVLASERTGDAEPMTALGDLFRGHNRYAEAIPAYDSALARTSHIEQRDWRLFYSRGVALERSGQWPRAEADLKRALELQPQQPVVLNYLGYSWIDQGVHLDEALNMVQRAVSLRPDDGYIIDSLGWAYYRIGDFAKATENLERAIELVPEDPTINDHLGDAYWQTGRKTEARFQWRRALQFKPEADEEKTIQAKLAHGLDKAVATETKGG